MMEEGIDGFPEEILIVDDMNENLNLLDRILSKAGYRVRSATDGQLAIRSVIARAPALILLDVMMPEMDGYEVCRWLKEDKRTGSIPIIFISALEDEREKVRGFKAGGVDYINKPFHSNEVLARVETHLALRRAHLELERKNAELSTARDSLEERVRERTAELAEANANLKAEISERIKTEEALRKSESRYMELFEDSPISLWEEDFSGVKARLENLRWEGISDFRAYFAGHPDIVSELLSLVRIIDMNEASLRLYGAGNKSDLLSGLEQFFPPEPLSAFGEELIFITEGKTSFEWEGVNRTLSGAPINVRLRFSVIPGCEQTFSRVLVSIEDITERTRNEERIRKALREKEILLRELYHRTNNNMQLINSILDLRLRDLGDKGIQNILFDMMNRINSMAIVHEKLYQSDDLSRINLGEYILDLAQSLRAGMGIPDTKAGYDLSLMDDVTISIDSALPCGLILNELLTNALRHAFPGDRAGKITVSLHRDPERVIRFSVSDNGIGVPPGFDFRTGMRIGYLIVFNLVENQLLGNIDIGTERGVSCAVTFRDDRQYPDHVQV